LTTKSIAILPFLNISAEPENEYFSDGLTEEVINALTKVEGLKVTARTSSFAFKGQNQDVRTIGKQLNVSTILEGSVRMAADRVRITAQLINVEDGFHFWSEIFDRNLSDIFELQDEISLLIADKLREHVGHFEIQEQFSKPSKLPVQLYKKYLKGRYYIHKMNKVDVEKGLQIIEEVATAVPDYPMAHLLIHKGYSFLGSAGLSSTKFALEKGSFHLQQAIRINDQLPDCQFHIAGNHFWKSWNLSASYRHLHQALALQPSFAEAYQLMAFLLALEGKFKAAFMQIDKALQLDPLSAVNHYYKGCFFYFQENYDQAIPHFQKALSIEKRFIFARMMWGACLLQLGRKAEGLIFYQNMPPEGVPNLTKLGGSTLAYAMLQDQEKTKEGLQQLKEAIDTPVMDRALFFLIVIYTTLGKQAEALKWIAKAIDQKVTLVIALPIEPLLKPIHNHPKFQQLMSGVLGQHSISIATAKKYKKSPLKKADAEHYYDKLESFMRREQPFLEPQLSLRQLAQMIDLHPNYLSQLLNERIGLNFSEYINGYRLDSFKNSVQNPKNQHLTLLGLALDSGFSSKTVFNTFFKKQMGMTPREYWKTIAES